MYWLLEMPFSLHWFWRKTRCLLSLDPHESQPQTSCESLLYAYCPPAGKRKIHQQPASGNANMVLQYMKLNISVKQKEMRKIPVQIHYGISSRTFTIEVQEIEINWKDTNSNEGK